MCIKIKATMPKSERIHRRNHGYRFKTPYLTQKQGEQIMHKMQEKDVQKALVTKSSAYAEYPGQVSYKKGTDSATTHLDYDVESLEQTWPLVVKDYHEAPSSCIVYNYTDEELSGKYDPAQRAKNQSDLQTLKTTSAKKLVEEGIIPATKYNLIQKTQNDLGIILQEDGPKKRFPPGKKVVLSFLVNGQEKPVELVVPTNSQNEEDRDEIDTEMIDSCTEKLYMSKLPHFKRKVKHDNKQQHYWLWSRQPSVGKTLNVDVLNQIGFVMRTRFHAGFWDHFDEQAQFIVLDEYGNGRGTEAKNRIIPICDLNSMCDGNYQFNTKHRNPAFVNEKSPLIIVMSNKPPRDVYTIYDNKQNKHLPDVGNLSLLYARFHVVQIDDDSDGNDIKYLNFLHLLASDVNDLSYKKIFKDIIKQNRIQASDFLDISSTFHPFVSQLAERYKKELVHYGHVNNKALYDEFVRWFREMYYPSMTYEEADKFIQFRLRTETVEFQRTYEYVTTVVSLDDYI